MKELESRTPKSKIENITIKYDTHLTKVFLLLNRLKDVNSSNQSFANTTVTAAMLRAVLVLLLL